MQQEGTRNSKAGINPSTLITHWEYKCLSASHNYVNHYEHITIMQTKYQK